MAARELVRTGIAGLDNILGGGIPRGNVILLEGAVGTGKTTMGVEFVYRGALEFGEPGLIVLFESSPDRLISDMAELGWDLSALVDAGALKIIFTTREVFAQELQQADSLLLEEAAAIGARRMFVDGVPGAGGVLASGGTVPRWDTFHLLADGLQREGLTAILAVEATRFQDEWPKALPEEAIVDTIIRLRTEEVARATVRSVQVVKSRGHDFQMGRHTFRIIAGTGIEVYRRVQAPRHARDDAAAFDPTTRITPGIPGLAGLLNGGYLLGSTTVVAGISGVGKSVMGLQFWPRGRVSGSAA